MSPTMRIVALAAVLVVLGAAFFMFGQSSGNEETKDFPPHSVQQ